MEQMEQCYNKIVSSLEQLPSSSETDFWSYYHDAANEIIYIFARSQANGVFDSLFNSNYRNYITSTVRIRVRSYCVDHCPVPSHFGQPLPPNYNPITAFPVVETFYYQLTPCDVGASADLQGNAIGHLWLTYQEEGNWLDVSMHGLNEPRLNAILYSNNTDPINSTLSVIHNLGSGLPPYRMRFQLTDDEFTAVKAHDQRVGMRVEVSPGDQRGLCTDNVQAGTPPGTPPRTFTSSPTRTYKNRVTN
jgi:hypothetical protein